VLGVNRVGTDGNGVAHSGHTALFDFAGKTLLRAPDGEEAVMMADLDPDALKFYRRQLPFLRDWDGFAINSMNFNTSPSGMNNKEVDF